MQQLGNVRYPGQDIEGADNYATLNSWVTELSSIERSNRWENRHSKELADLANRVDHLCKRLKNSPLDDAGRREFQNILQLKDTIKTLKQKDRCRCWNSPGYRTLCLVLCALFVGGAISSMVILVARENK